MSKNWVWVIGIATAVWLGCLYHTITINSLQDKYEKTCASSVKKSERISELVKQLR